MQLYTAVRLLGYPLPLQDLFAGLAGCKVFCALDLEGAYTQLSLTKRSRKFMIINTIKGLFTYNRLPQGASSSASIFQQIMDQVLQGIEYPSNRTAVYSCINITLYDTIEYGI